ncbi:MFS transporter [Novosphingobium piscinae]|uniref:MFS transporter n=1 Tax=Novosphingobium piscinae TaxID=1507448 RepID=A0A7X1KQH3_9SPHN|nr:MFS transporter [Novosphingobium piscinae]MBC2669762.1 MFS transporter [Novosphingobium piscinae]
MTPTRVRRQVVGIALALAILAYVQRVAISQAAGPISTDLGLDKAQMGMVFGAFGLSYALFEIPMGLSGDRLGVKKILTRLVLAWSFFTALTGAAWSLASMWVIRFLFGAGEAGCFPNLTRMLSQWLPRPERVKAQALMWACTRWGGAVTPPLVLLAINVVGWRWAFVMFGLLGVAWVLWFRRSFTENPANHPGVNEAELALLAESQALVGQSHGSWLALLLRPQALLLCVQYFCWSYVWYFFVTWMPTFLGEVHGQSAAGMAGLSVLPLLMGGLGSLTAGLLPLAIPRHTVAIICFISVAILMALVPFAPNVWVAIGLLALTAFLGDMLVPISWNQCVELGQGYTATMGAAMNMFANFSGFLAPVVGGMLLKASGNDWAPMLWLMSGVAGLGAMSWIIMGAAGTAPAVAKG